MRRRTRSFPYEDLFVGGVAIIAAVVCALALLDVPHATATRGVSYSNFVRAPVEQPVFAPDTPIVPEPLVAEHPALPVPADVASLPLTCSPDAEAELQRLLELCRG